ncbi:Hydroxycinnamoyl-Coenzyme A shikimate quinate hydroxycinnamoyltransferase [Fusarium acutatum]|uniref:Hydroxycinnamoyl-Coenzyme A shikimate quinate hydroxycinnamoyltransferase n=1 Tax=Fusarium acutatum TaxID=78861 RepID=A0A8H4NBG2_9HYPO|nr:Hydroxycinnamoyl-Coenzyme A shikimate quinate hydroxycinnamoyltransferase [Fusarium acutatum]
MTTINISIVESHRLNITTSHEQAIPLSLLDGTTANFSNASAIWLFEKPTRDDFNLAYHLRESLARTLRFYPQWGGHLKAVKSIDGTVPPEAKSFPPHARRFGRLYAHYGTDNDPGVEFVHAKCDATLESFYPAERISKQPFWKCDSSVFQKFMAPATISQPLKDVVEDGNGEVYPLLAIQMTELSCGGFALALNGAHPLADATTLLAFIKHWAHESGQGLGNNLPASKPVFNPALIDNQAAGDIDANEPDLDVIQRTKSLPMHRFDWWHPDSTPPWPFKIPSPFYKQGFEPVGKPMPWAEWNVAEPVSNYVVHLTQKQVICLWKMANENSSQKLSQHDAILSHIWSCIARARGLENETDSIHCDLVYGVRSSFHLKEDFLGSPVVMMNIELPAREVANPSSITQVATQVRNTLKTISDPSNMAAHLHSLAFEKSPQRIWQAFLGRRHILLTTWARAGIYDVDFGRADLEKLNAYQKAKPSSRSFQLRLIEMTACALHQIGVQLSQLEKFHDPATTAGHDIESTIKWERPPDDLCRIPPKPTMFIATQFTAHDRYPNGVDDMVGYWAENRILGGVALFDRSQTWTGGDEPNFYFQCTRERVTFRVCQLLDTQQSALISFLLADPEDANNKCPLPILPTSENRVRIDPGDAIPVKKVYRDIWERKHSPRRWRAPRLERPKTSLDY